MGKLSVKGKFKDGIARPNEPVATSQERDVTITFLDDDETNSTPAHKTDWDALSQIIEANQMETGITDLADEHDHYLYGSPKRKES